MAGMTTSSYIALLRGINVGRAKRVAMADLRQLVGELGYTGVRSLLNSGNLVFRGVGVKAASAARRIEEALVLKLGVAARVTVLARAELDAVIGACPLLPAASDLSRLMVFVVNEPAALDAVAPLTRQDWAPDALAVGKRAAYVWCPNGVLDSRAVTALSRVLGDGVTARNWNTITRLQSLCADMSTA